VPLLLLTYWADKDILIFVLKFFGALTLLLLLHHRLRFIMVSLICRDVVDPMQIDRGLQILSALVRVDLLKLT